MYKKKLLSENISNEYLKVLILKKKIELKVLILKKKKIEKYWKFKVI